MENTKKFMVTCCYTDDLGVVIEGEPQETYLYAVCKEAALRATLRDIPLLVDYSAVVLVSNTDGASSQLYDVRVNKELGVATITYDVTISGGNGGH